MFTLTKEHPNTDLIPSRQALLVSGHLDIIGFGSASAALYNGTAFQPYLLTSTSSNEPGSVAQTFVQNPRSVFRKGGTMALGFIVLIALAVALALTFLLVVFIIAAEHLRRRREGYVRAPTTAQMFGKGSDNGFNRVPPEHLFAEKGWNGAMYRI